MTSNSFRPFFSAVLSRSSLSPKSTQSWPTLPSMLELETTSLKNEYEPLEDKPEYAPPRPPKPKPIIKEEPVLEVIFIPKVQRPHTVKRMNLWREDPAFVKLTTSEAEKMIVPIPTSETAKFGQAKQSKVRRAKQLIN